MPLIISQLAFLHSGVKYDHLFLLFSPFTRQHAPAPACTYALLPAVPLLHTFLISHRFNLESPHLSSQISSQAMASGCSSSVSRANHTRLVSLADPSAAAHLGTTEKGLLHRGMMEHQKRCCKEGLPCVSQHARIISGCLHQNFRAVLCRYSQHMQRGISEVSHVFSAENPSSCPRNLVVGVPPRQLKHQQVEAGCQHPAVYLVQV